MTSDNILTKGMCSHSFMLIITTDETQCLISLQTEYAFELWTPEVVFCTTKSNIPRSPQNTFIFTFISMTTPLLCFLIIFPVKLQQIVFVAITILFPLWLK